MLNFQVTTFISYTQLENSVFFWAQKSCFRRMWSIGFRFISPGPLLYSVFTFEKFYKKSDLKTHTKLHAGVKDYACNVCSRQFSHVSNLNRHKLTHKKEKPFPCQLCGQRYNQIATLNQHLKKHNNDSNVCLVSIAVWFIRKCVTLFKDNLLSQFYFPGLFPLFLIHT